MRKSTKALLVLSLIATVCVTRSFGQTLRIQVDEYGHMLINGSPGPAGFVAPEPVSGTPTLCYPIPLFGNFGDILLLEPPATNYSDILRFSQDGLLYFFSFTTAAEPPEPGVLADGPLPALIPGFLVFTETGPEAGPNGLFGYTAFPLDIGGSPAFPGGVTYDFFSDGVIPEPSPLMLGSLGGGLLCALRLRRQIPPAAKRRCRRQNTGHFIRDPVG